MGEEAYDEFELHAVEGDKKRTLVIRGGYSRDEVWIGIGARDDHYCAEPDEAIADEN